MDRWKIIRLSACLAALVAMLLLGCFALVRSALETSAPDPTDPFGSYPGPFEQTLLRPNPLRRLKREYWAAEIELGRGDLSSADFDDLIELITWTVQPSSRWENMSRAPGQGQTLIDPPEPPSHDASDKHVALGRFVDTPPEGW